MCLLGYSLENTFLKCIMYAQVEDKYRKNMKVLHYIPSIDQTSGGVGSYLKLLASSLGKLVELNVVSHHSLMSYIFQIVKFIILIMD